MLFIVKTTQPFASDSSLETLFAIQAEVSIISSSLRIFFDILSSTTNYDSIITNPISFVNKKEIYKRANKMYVAVTKHKNNFLKTIACNFKLLEEKSIEYNKQQ